MTKQNLIFLCFFFLQLCVAFVLVEAKPQGNAFFTGNNKAGNDLVGVQNNAAGSKPTYQPGSKHVTYDVSGDVSGNTGPVTFGASSGNSISAGKNSVAAGGAQSGTIKVISKIFLTQIYFLFHEDEKAYILGPKPFNLESI